MQFEGKLMNQTWENSIPNNFGPNFGLSAANLDAKYFFREFYLYQYTVIVPRYYPMQCKRKVTNQTWENAKKNFGPNLYPKKFFQRFTTTGN